MAVQASDDADGLVALVGAVRAASASEWASLRSTLSAGIASDPEVASAQVGGLSVEVHQQASADRTGICIRGDQGTACERVAGLAPAWASIDLAGQWWIVGVSHVPLTVKVGDAKVNTSSVDGSFGFTAAIPNSERRIDVAISSTADQPDGALSGDNVVDNETVVRPAS
jgi:hypothetical protein